jgi:hypothetical protein
MGIGRRKYGSGSITRAGPSCGTSRTAMSPPIITEPQHSSKGRHRGGRFPCHGDYPSERLSTAVSSFSGG